MKYDENDDKNSRVSETSDWIEIAKIKDDFKGKIGVFMFADDENEVLFATQLENFSKSLKAGKDIECTKLKVLFTHTSNDKIPLLFYLLNKYKPMYNFRSKVDLF